MRALVFDNNLRFDKNYPEPELLPGEALIRPHLVGICNTDIEITRGYANFGGVLGHEFVGSVVACDDQAWIGRRVVGEINATCGSCVACQRGDSTHCFKRTTLGIHGRNGAMADRFSLPILCLHEVPPNVSDSAAVFTEPLAAAFEILEQSHVRPSERVAVVGDGKLGMLCAQVMRLIGSDVVVIGRHAERTALLHDLGISTAPASPLSFDVVVDCTGNASGLATARQLVRPRGRLILKSTYAGQSSLDLSSLVVDEVSLVGSRCGPFAPALRALSRNLIAVEPLIAARFLLHQALEAFESTRGQLKILLEV